MGELLSIAGQFLLAKVYVTFAVLPVYLMVFGLVRPARDGSWE